MKKIAATIYFAFCFLMGFLWAPMDEPIVWISKGIGFALFGIVSFVYLTYVYEKGK